MRFSILVTASPQRPGAVTALRTVQAVCRSSHELYRVFLYGDAVQLANRFAVCGGSRGSARQSAQQQWQAWVTDAAVPVRVCVGAALRRGVADELEARRAGLDGASLASGFRLSGLGDWVDALSHSDRVVHFG